MDACCREVLGHTRSEDLGQCDAGLGDWEVVSSCWPVFVVVGLVVGVVYGVNARKGLMGVCWYWFGGLRVSSFDIAVVVVEFVNLEG